MADFFGFNSTADFEQGLHDDPGGGLDEDADDYDALNDETFGADCLGGDWEQGHEDLAQMSTSRARQDSYNSGNGEPITAQDFDDDLGLEDLDLEASISQLVDDNEESLTEGPKLKNKNHRPGVIELGYSCSPPSEFNVWAVGKHDQVHQPAIQKTIIQSQQVLPTVKKIHTLEELERGLRSQSRSVIGQQPQSAGPRLAELETPCVLIGQPRPPAALRLEDVERDLTSAKNKMPPGFSNRNPPQFPHPHMQDMVMNRNGFAGHPGMRGAPPGGNFGPVLMQGGPMMEFPHHPHHPQHRHPHHMGNPNMLRFLPPHMMLGAQQQMRNNLAFRPPYPMPGTMGPMHPGFRLPFPHPAMGPGMRGLPMRGPPMRGPPRENGYHRDEYEGLMSNREIQWLLNIQLLQLNTTQPFQDDFYYTVYQSRKPKNRSESRNNRERRDSQSQLGQQQRTYTPLQFENSLGKLQVGSVTAPRKIMDMEVVSSEVGTDNTQAAVQKDSRRVKQLLLLLEQLYLVLMQLEDADNPLCDTRNLLVDKPALVQKIIAPLLTEDKLQAALGVRKGKNLLLRLLPYLPSEGQPGQMCEVFTCVLRNLVAIGRRDIEPSVLPNLHEPMKQYLSHVTAHELGTLVEALRVTQHLPPSRNLLVFTLGNKFGISALASLLTRGEELLSAAEEPTLPHWSVFIEELLEASSLVSSENAATPLVGMQEEVLRRHLGRFSEVKREKHEFLIELLAAGNNGTNVN